MRNNCILLLLLALFFCAGCGAGLRENLRGIAGISTKTLEDNLPNAAVQEFNLGYGAAYSKTKSILKEINAFIYTLDESQKLIALYVSEKDTTPVGIFFKEIGGGKVQLQVSSPSSYAKEFIAGKIFAGLEK